MKRTSATYENSAIGFPGVVLKLYEENGKVISGYWVLKGIVQGPWHFSPSYRPGYAGDLNHEIQSFDAMVRSRFSEDITVQG